MAIPKLATEEYPVIGAPTPPPYPQPLNVGTQTITVLPPKDAMTSGGIPVSYTPPVSRRETEKGPVPGSEPSLAGFGPIILLALAGAVVYRMLKGN